MPVLQPQSLPPLLAVCVRFWCRPDTAWGVCISHALFKVPHAGRVWNMQLTRPVCGVCVSRQRHNEEERWHKCLLPQEAYRELDALQQIRHFFLVLLFIGGCSGFVRAGPRRALSVFTQREGQGQTDSLMWHYYYTRAVHRDPACAADCNLHVGCHADLAAQEQAETLGAPPPFSSSQ